jgi:uncharacterized protein with von Willebrand factor type A (vWA) domain
MSAGLVERVVELCRALREQGMVVTTAHALDAVQALRSVGVQRRDRAYHALRCVLAARPEEFEVFDELFAHFFSAPQEGRGRATARVRRAPKQEAAVVPSLDAWGSA